MNRWKNLLALLASGALISGCTVPVKELRHSGGYPGHLMDKQLFDASGSKQLQLLRATMIIAMASRVGTAYVRDGREAEAFIDYLQNATDEVNYIASHVYEADGEAPCLTLEDADCTGSYRALFESDLPQLEYKIVRLVMAALPQRQAAEFADTARTGNGMSAAWKALRLALAALDGAHRGAAVYRSSEEVLALLVSSASKCASGQAMEIATTNHAVQCLGLSPDSLTENPDRVKDIPAEVGKGAFHPLFDIIKTSCWLLPLDVDLSRVRTANGEPAGEAVVTNRADRCDSLAFAPRLRFAKTAAVQDRGSAPGTAPPTGTSPVANPQ